MIGKSEADGIGPVGEVSLAIVGGIVGAADGEEECGKAPVIWEVGNLVQGPGPGCFERGVKSGQHGGDASGQGFPVVFASDSHGRCQEFRVVAGGGGERILDSLKNGGDRAFWENADDSSDGGVDGAQDNDCVFNCGDGGNAECLYEVLGVVAGNGDWWWRWGCGDAWGRGVCEATGLVDVCREPSGALPDDGWRWW